MEPLSIFISLWIAEKYYKFLEDYAEICNKRDEQNKTEKYLEYYGRGVDKIISLIGDGRIPMSVSQILQERIKYKDFFREKSGLMKFLANPFWEETWRLNSFSTGDCVAYHPSGKLKLVLDCEYLRKVNSESVIKKGALVIDDTIYDSLNGREFDSISILDSYNLGDIKNHPGWKFLARNQDLLDKYNSYLSSQEYYSPSEYGNFLFSSSKSKEPIIRPICLGGATVETSFISDGDLCFYGNRFVGVFPNEIK